MKQILLSPCYWVYSSIGIFIAFRTGAFIVAPLWMGCIAGFAYLYKKTLEDWSEKEGNDNQ